MRFMLIILTIAVSLFVAQGQQSPFTDAEIQDIVRNYIEGNRKSGYGPWPLVNDYYRIDRKKLCQLLIPYISDPNPSVRVSVAMRVGQFGDRDVVMPLARALDDGDHNVRYEALRSLRGLPPNELKVHQEQLLPVLIKVGHRLEIESAQAIVLLAELDSVKATTELKKIREEVGVAIRGGRAKQKVMEALHHSCAFVLAKLGDENAVNEYGGLVESPDMRTRIEAIEWAHYIGPRIAGHLVPLLEDKRDAVQVGSIFSTHYARICDLAAYALIRIFGLKPSFSTDDPRRSKTQFTDEQIREIRTLCSRNPPKTH